MRTHKQAPQTQWLHCTLLKLSDLQWRQKAMIPILTVYYRNGTLIRVRTQVRVLQILNFEQSIKYNGALDDSESNFMEHSSYIDFRLFWVMKMHIAFNDNLLGKSVRTVSTNEYLLQECTWKGQCYTSKSSQMNFLSHIWGNKERLLLIWMSAHEGSYCT